MSLIRTLEYRAPRLSGRLLVWACCLAATACVSSRGLHPSATLADPATVAVSRSLAAVPLSPTAWPAEDWWVGFGDPQLTRLINEALQNNPSLEEAQARARAAQANADGAEATLGPNVDLDNNVLGAQLSRDDALYPAYTLGRFGWLKTASLNFSWDLDLWGGKRAAWESAVGRSRAAQVEAYGARIQLSVNVARAYVRLGYAFSQKDVADAEFKRAGTSLDLTRRLVRGGLGTPQQEALADSQLSGAEQQGEQADRAIDAARSALSVLVGQGPDRGLAIERPRLLNPIENIVPDDLSAGLIGRRADLVAARWHVEAAARNISATKAEFLPNISLSAMAGFAVLGPANLFALPARTYSAGPALTLPIFDGGHLRAKLAADDAGYEQAVARYNALLIAALNEASDRLSALRSIRRQIALEKRSQQDAQKSWTDALTAYRGGVSGPLTPLISRQQLLVAEQRTAILESEEADVSMRLIEALGGGFNTAAISAR